MKTFHSLLFFLVFTTTLLTATAQTQRSDSNSTTVKQRAGGNSVQILTFSALPSKVYSTTTFNLGASSNANGASINYTSSNTAVATISNTNKVTLKGAGTTIITASSGSHGQYAAAADVSQVLTVTPKPLTFLNGVIALNKSYDGTTSATISGTLTGIINSEVVGFIGIGDFASAEVGSNIAVTASCVLTGAKAANYTLTQPTSLKAGITMGKPIITWSQDFTKLTTSNDYKDLNAVSNISVGSKIYYTSNNTSVVKIGVGVLVVVGAGSAIITAHQDGSANYSAADAVNLDVVVTPSIPLQVTGITDLSALTTDETTDLVVAAGGTLTVNIDKTINTITVSPLGKLNFNDGKILTLKGNVKFAADETGSFSTHFGISGSMQVEGRASYTKKMNYHDWYFVSFPFAVAVNKIKAEDGSSLGTLGTDWFIRYYDGDGRSKNAGSISNWKAPELGADSLLTPNQGYIIGLKDNHPDVTVSFPLSIGNEITEVEQTIPVVAHGFGSTEIGDNNKGWNLVGQPYLSKYAGVGCSAPFLVKYEQGTYSTYTSSDIANIDPFSAYFVQANDILESEGVIFDLYGRLQAPSIVKNETKRVKLNFTTGTGTDVTNLIFNPSQSTAYQIGQDMEKWISTGTNKPQVYTTLAGVNYAFNALPMQSTKELELNFYTKSAGTSTISAVISNSTGLKQLLLKDKVTGTTTDLLTTNYSFNTTAGTNTTRFSVTAIEEGVTATNEIKMNDKEEPSVSIVGNLLVIRNYNNNSMVKVIDVLGHLIASKSIDAGSMEIPLANNGIYTVQIQSTDRQWTKKVMFIK